MALLFISLILLRRKSVPSGRRTSLRGPTCTQTFNLVQPGPAGRQGPLGKEEGREGGGASSDCTLIGFSNIVTVCSLPLQRHPGSQSCKMTRCTCCDIDTSNAPGCPSQYVQVCSHPGYGLESKHQTEPILYDLSQLLMQPLIF